MPHSKRPSQEDKDLLVTKARNITDVVVACRETGLEWFEQLLDTLFKPKEDKDDATKKNTEASPMLVLACQQIVDCLVESVLRMEESTSEMPSADPMAAVTGKPAGSISASKRLVACLTTLYLFAKIRPQLLVEHVQVTINSIKFLLGISKIQLTDFSDFPAILGTVQATTYVDDSIKNFLVNLLSNTNVCYLNIEFSYLLSDT